MNVLSLIIGAIALLAAVVGVVTLVLKASARADKKRKENAHFANQPWDNAGGRANR